MDNNDTAIETTEPVVEFKFHKENLIPAIKRNSKKLIAGAAIIAAGTALSLMAFRSVPEIEDPEEVEHDDLDEIDADSESDSTEE